MEFGLESDFTLDVQQLRFLAGVWKICKLLVLPANVL